MDKFVVRLKHLQCVLVRKVRAGGHKGVGPTIASREVSRLDGIDDGRNDSIDVVILELRIVLASAERRFV